MGQTLTSWWTPREFANSCSFLHWELYRPIPTLVLVCETWVNPHSRSFKSLLLNPHSIDMKNPPLIDDRFLGKPWVFHIFVFFRYTSMLVEYKDFLPARLVRLCLCRYFATSTVKCCICAFDRYRCLTVCKIHPTFPKSPSLPQSLPRQVLRHVCQQPLVDGWQPGKRCGYDSPAWYAAGRKRGDFTMLRTGI